MTIPTPFLVPALLAAAVPSLATAPVPAHAALARPAAAAPTPLLPQGDPCDGVASFAADGACDGPLCSRRERVTLACELRDALEKRYVFFPVKGRMLSRQGSEPFDSRAHLDRCVAGERAIAREDDALQFYDRMRRCTAAFEDGHLLLTAPVRLPQVALGISLRLVDGRVYIASRERKLVSYLKTISGAQDLDDLLAVGNEVVEIDGRPVAEVLADVAALLPASSEAARQERAVDALTRRDFAYPSRSAATIAVAVKGGRRTVELPWWAAPDAKTHLMTQAWQRRTGIATTELLNWRYDAARDSWDRDAGAAEGYLRTDTILPPRDAARLREYVDGDDRPAVRLGEVVRRRDRAFCYLQILTFHTETLGSRDGRQPFTSVLEGFVKECKEKDLDLVLDLRQNDGGYLSHTSALTAMLAEGQKTYPAGALLLRASTQNQLVFQQRAPVLGAAPARASEDALEPRRVAEAIGAARKAQQDFTPAFLEAPLRSSDAVGGYPGRVVALVAPTCMSACDRIAGMLRSSGRAVLVGTPTEGAGGSQQEARNLAVRWSDPEGVLSLAIPNAAMGVQRALPRPGETSSGVDAHDFFETLALENRPIVPDVPYATGLSDITGHNRGWLEKVEAVMFPHEAGTASAR
jgi:hypothetical protein